MKNVKALVVGLFIAFVLSVVLWFILVKLFFLSLSFLSILTFSVIGLFVVDIGLSVYLIPLRKEYEKGMRSGKTSWAAIESAQEKTGIKLSKTLERSLIRTWNK